jgi:hypothetical protein
LSGFAVDGVALDVIQAPKQESLESRQVEPLRGAVETAAIGHATTARNNSKLSM